MPDLNCPICGTTSLRSPSRCGGIWLARCAECFSEVEIEPFVEPQTARLTFRVKGYTQLSSPREADLYRRRTAF